MVTSIKVIHENSKTLCRQYTNVDKSSFSRILKILKNIEDTVGSCTKKKLNLNYNF